MEFYRVCTFDEKDISYTNDDDDDDDDDTKEK